MLQTVEKAAQVLNLFTPGRPEWGVTQIAAALGWPKSSTHDLLSSLAEVGLLYRVVTGRYRLGFRLLTLSQALLHNTPWRDVAQEELQRLRAALGERVELCVLAGGQVVTVARLDGHRPEAGTPSPVGGVLPVHATAHGKVLLCERPWAFVAAVLEQRGLPPLTARTVTSPDRLRRELRRVREEGVATEVEELQAGLCAVAAPVRNHNGEIIAGIGVTLGAGRFPAREAEVRAAVQAAAAAVSDRIGFNPEFTAAGAYWWTSVDGRDELSPARPIRSKRSGDGPDDPRA